MNKTLDLRVERCLQLLGNLKQTAARFAKRENLLNRELGGQHAEFRIDLGHGAGSFYWYVAVPAYAEHFYPDSISTDLHINSMNAGMKDMAHSMSKILNLGSSLAAGDALPRFGRIGTAALAGGAALAGAWLLRELD